MTAEATALYEAAAKVVEDLWKGRSVRGAPERDPGWNEAFVAAIRHLKARFHDSPDLGPALEIVADRLYGKEIHWALELIQNADDAGARQIRFEFDQDKVQVYNDGDPFTAEDVWGICSVRQSRKRNKIGLSNGVTSGIGAGATQGAWSGCFHG